MRLAIVALAVALVGCAGCRTSWDAEYDRGRQDGYRAAVDSVRIVREFEDVAWTHALVVGDSTIYRRVYPDTLSPATVYYYCTPGGPFRQGPR